MLISDWSSDVCSSDLLHQRGVLARAGDRDRLGRAEKLAAVDHIGDCEANLAVAVEESDASVQPRDSRRIVLDFHCRVHCRGLGLLKCRIAERSEEHTSELQSLMRISYAVFCSQKKNSDRVERQTTHTDTLAASVKTQ